MGHVDVPTDKSTCRHMHAQAYPRDERDGDGDIARALQRHSQGTWAACSCSCLSGLNKQRNLHPTGRGALCRRRHSSHGRLMEPSNLFQAFLIKLDSFNPPRRLQPIGFMLQALLHNFWKSD